MKVLILIALITFIVVSGVTMYLTGTFQAVLGRGQTPQEPDGTDQTVKTEGNDAEIQDGVQEDGVQENEAATPLAEAQAKLELADYKAQIAEAETKLADYETRIKEAKTQLATIRTEALALNSMTTFASRIQQLAKIYGEMKPDNAAEILSGLEVSLSMKIITKMDSKTSGKIMDAIATKNPDYVTRISKLIAKSDMPGDYQTLIRQSTSKTTATN